MASKNPRRVRRNMASAEAARQGVGRIQKGEGAAASDLPGTVEEQPRCAVVASGGINTADDMIRFNGAMISDVLARRLPNATAGVINGANRNTLKAAEMQHRYGRQVDKDGRKDMVFCAAATPATPALPAEPARRGDGRQS